MVAYRKNELYQEMELFNDDGVKIGEAEVDTKGQMLSRLTIFEPYRNKGYGERAVTELTYMYDLRELWVNQAGKSKMWSMPRTGLLVHVRF